MEMFAVLIMVMVSLVHAYVKIHQVVHFNFVQYLIL